MIKKVTNVGGSRDEASETGRSREGSMIANQVRES